MNNHSGFKTPEVTSKYAGSAADGANISDETTSNAKFAISDDTLFTGGNADETECLDITDTHLPESWINISNTDFFKNINKLDVGVFQSHIPKLHTVQHILSNKLIRIVFLTTSLYQTQI